MSLRSDRAQRRANQLRTRRIILIVIAIIIVAILGYLIYSNVVNPSTPESILIITEKLSHPSFRG